MRFPACMIAAAVLALTLPAVGFAADGPIADKPAEPDAGELLKTIPVVTDADEKIESLIGGIDRREKEDVLFIIKKNTE